MTLSQAAIICACGALLACSDRISFASGTPETTTKCKGDNFVLNEPNSEAIAHHVFVFRNGESVASTSVQATGDLQGRLKVDPDSMVTLQNLSLSDIGIYRVDVKLVDGRHTERTVRLVVGEPPETTDGKLLAVHDFFNDTLVRLKCGPFTSLGYPPVSVSWKDPRGQVLSSSDFSDPFFTLDLPMKVAEPGQYCCQLDCREPNYCCLDSQSPFRHCAEVELQTNEAVPEIKARNEDSVPLSSFISLVQQVSALDVVVQELERARNGQDCSESGVSAMAHLVLRQTKCDQLDTYMKRVDAIENKFESDLMDVSSVTKDLQGQLEKINQSKADFPLRIQDDIAGVNQSLNIEYVQSDSKIKEINATVQATLLKLLQVDKHLSKIDDAISKLNDKMAKVENWISDASDHHTQMTTSLMLTGQNCTDLKTTTDHGMSKIMCQIASIENVLHNHVNRSDETIKAFNETLFSLTRGCPVQKGYKVYNERCLKLYMIMVNYTEARRRCKDDGTHLFHFKSRDLDTPPLVSLFVSNGLRPPSQFWVGADDIAREGHFVWSDGTTLPAYSELWESWEPNGDTYVEGQDCVDLWNNKDGGFYLHDYDCHNRETFVCQADLN